jgi:hypothetical protein
LAPTFQNGKNITNDLKLYYTKIIPNGHKIFQMGIKNQHLPFKGPPKFTQIWDFWFEKKPSGNPAVESTLFRDRMTETFQKFKTRNWGQCSNF